jgi:Leucine-rich repeat (LRR) protein
MKYLKYFENLEYIYYSNQNLTTLKDKNIPKHISGSFWCNDNQLISLVYCPETVGGGFDCSNNQLTSLEYGPKTVNGYFNCRNNELTSLKYCPKTVEGDFYCSDNQLTSLEFCPEYVGEDFSCSHNQLTSLDYAPEYVGGDFDCNENNWTNVIPFELIKKFNIRKWNLYTKEQKEKFYSYEYQKEYLTNSPEKYKDLEPIGFNDKIKDEFDWLFNAIDMELM